MSDTESADLSYTPAQSEAEGIETITVNHKGHDFTFPADPLDWPTRVMRAFEEGKAMAVIRGLVTQKVYEKVGIDDWPVRETTALFEKFAKASGLDDAGE